jgi:hypothetical protein
MRVRDLVLGDEDQTRSLAVEAMAEPRHDIELGLLEVAVAAVQVIDQRAATASAGRMHREAGCLVDRHEPAILPDDVELRILVAGRRLLVGRARRDIHDQDVVLTHAPRSTRSLGGARGFFGREGRRADVHAPRLDEPRHRAARAPREERGQRLIDAQTLELGVDAHPHPLDGLAEIGGRFARDLRDHLGARSSGRRVGTERRTARARLLRALAVRLSPMRFRCASSGSRARPTRIRAGLAGR